MRGAPAAGGAGAKEEEAKDDDAGTALGAEDPGLAVSQLAHCEVPKGFITSQVGHLGYSWESSG